MTGFPSFDLGELGTDGLEDRLNEVRGDPTSAARELQQAMAEIRGTGASEDGTVAAVTSTDGTLMELTVDPRLLRKGSEVLAATVMEAVNAAAADARGQVGEQLQGGTNPAAKAATDLQRGLDNVIDQVLADVARIQDRLR
ncbi:YbaB/EbfC family nucleoid-associated protein [Actinopolymorpha sp. B17G11]|uniref:YbaB/EbfC family nucleoid-associated protein n=1 Tax=unclassified Actinopolymorpha TaxID=2627063 RepID=UPI0032D903AF